MASSMTRRGFITLAAGAMATVALAGCSSSETGPASGNESEQTENAHQAANRGRSRTMIFINPSQNPNGNTAQMGRTLLEGMDYETINLIDYKIYPLGSFFPDDQFEKVWQKMCDADTIVWGTPIYWHAMAGPLKVLIDRMYDYQNGELEGKNLAFFQQGGAPRRESLDMNDYIVGRVASLYGMNLVGTSDSAEEIPALRSAIRAVL